MEIRTKIVHNNTLHTNQNDLRREFVSPEHAATLFLRVYESSFCTSKGAYETSRNRRVESWIDVVVVAEQSSTVLSSHYRSRRRVPRHLQTDDDRAPTTQLVLAAHRRRRRRSHNYQSKCRFHAGAGGHSLPPAQI